MVPVAGTDGAPFHFGARARTREADRCPPVLHLLHPVTQAFWLHVMGEDPFEESTPGRNGKVTQEYHIRGLLSAVRSPWSAVRGSGWLVAEG